VATNVFRAGQGVFQMGEAARSIRTWLVIAVAMVLPTASYAQVDPLSLVAKSFLQSLLKQMFTIEYLEGLGPADGRMAIQQAYERAKAQVDSSYGGERDRLVREREEAIKKQAPVQSYDRQIDGVLSRWAQSLKELERQRDQIIRAFSPYWEKHPDKQQLTM